MPAPPLTTEETAALAEAGELLAAGRAYEAAAKLGPLIRGGCRNPDLLMAFSVASEQLGNLQIAVNAAHLASEQAPERAEIWARLGELLENAGQSAAALTMLERAIAIDPANAAAHYNLGLAALSAGELERAGDAIRRSLELDEANASAWAVLGIVQQHRGELEVSEQSLRQAVELNPALLSAAHNLSVTLRLLDRPEEALAVLDDAISRGLAAPETKLVRAHLLADAGRLEDAVGDYRAIIRDNPGTVDAHEVLARLLPQLGGDAETTAAYDEALKVAPSIELYRSALGTAWDLKRADALARWASDAVSAFGALPDLELMRGLGEGLGGRPDAALAILEPLAAAGSGPALTHAAYYRLKQGDLDQAQAHALAATVRDPLDQAAWAFLTVIWRLLGDAREQWLADYERLVVPVELSPPASFADIGAFMAALSDELTALHTTLNHPGDQSLRQGTQTRGNLFDKRSPLIRQLKAMVVEAITEVACELPTDPTHPFLARKSDDLRFAGSWSVRLRRGGFHVSHIHQTGWMSSALYVALPPEVSAGGAEGAAGPGALTFGVPDRELGIDLPPRRVETPAVGRLVLFPSYLWHGTMPFESEDYRVTVAFDVAPA